MNAHKNVDCGSFRMKAGLQTNVVKGKFLLLTSN